MSYDTDTITGRASARTPILSLVYAVTGVLTLCGGGVFIISALSMENRGVYFQQALAVGCVLIFFALLQFGLAQLVSYVAETARNTRLNEQILATLERIEKQQKPSA